MGDEELRCYSQRAAYSTLGGHTRFEVVCEFICLVVIVLYYFWRVLLSLYIKHEALPF